MTLELTLLVYRDFSNRAAGEPDDGPLAWRAHRERQVVLTEALPAGAFRRSPSVADDTARPHELAEVVAEVLKDPTAGVLLSAAALYVLKVLLGQVDELVAKGVAFAFDRLASAFGRKRIGDFAIKLHDGSSVTVDPDSIVTLVFKGGKVEAFNIARAPR
jgi:hypothetical protein